MPHQAGDTLPTAGVDPLRLGPAASSSAAASADWPELDVSLLEDGRPVLQSFPFDVRLQPMECRHCWQRSQGVHPSGGGQLGPGYYVTVDGKVGKVRNFMTGRTRTPRPESPVSRVIARAVRRLAASAQSSRRARLAGQTFPQAVLVEQQNYISGSYGTYLCGTGRQFGLRELRKPWGTHVAWSTPSKEGGRCEQPRAGGVAEIAGIAETRGNSARRCARIFAHTTGAQELRGVA